MFLHDPYILLVFPLIMLLFLYRQKRQKAVASVRFSCDDLLKGLSSSFRVKLSNKLIYIRILSVLMFVIALARPQSPVYDSKILSEGIDIVLAIDCSTSMLAEDFKLAGKRQNRLDVVKSVVKDFVNGRSNDRIALVAFASRAYTVCPLTLDYGWLLTNLERVRIGLIEDGTAVGSGIAVSLNRLKNTAAKSKVIILLTDGRNNTGKIVPLVAAEAAKALRVKIYAIGAGSRGLVPYPAKDFFGNTVYQPVNIDIDEDTLMKISSETGGKYYRATDTDSLRGIYKEIDRLEKTSIEGLNYQEYNELFTVFLSIGLALLFCEIILSNTLLRKLP